MIKLFILGGMLCALLVSGFVLSSDAAPQKVMKGQEKKILQKKSPSKKAPSKEKVEMKKKKEAVSKQGKRMAQEMTKKGPVKIKKDELLKLREGELMKKEDALLKKGDIKIEKQEMPIQTMSYTGTVLAGTSAKLLDFTKADYDAARKTDKLIALYFYANWCPICKAEFPKMQEAFNGVTSDAVVGFRINYNDNETDDTERALAREFGVAYQHTKVLLKNGERVLKSPEGWEKDRYVTEINSRLTQ